MTIIKQHCYLLTLNKLCTREVTWKQMFAYVKSSLLAALEFSTVGEAEIGWVEREGCMCAMCDGDGSVD